MRPTASAWLARHPFLLLGLATIALFALIESRWISPTHGALLATLRILVIPFYPVWLALTMVQVQLGEVEDDWPSRADEPSECVTGRPEAATISARPAAPNAV
jgi:hypothetical protein